MSQEPRSNGTEPGAPTNPLGQAIEAHAKALINSISLPTGQVGINFVQLYCELQLTMVRFEVLAEALVEVGVLDPARLSIKLRDKLKAETQFMNAPQIAIASGSVLREPR